MDFDIKLEENNEKRNTLQYNIENMHQLLQGLLAKKKRLDESIERNEDAIKEKELEVENCIQDQEISYKIFSPRKINTIYEERIRRGREEISIIENENHSLYKERNNYNIMIEQFSSVYNYLCSLESKDEANSDDTSIAETEQEEIEERIEAETDSNEKQDTSLKEIKMEEGELEEKGDSFSLRICCSDEKVNVENCKILLRVQEDERKRIAKHLHDSVVQNIVHNIHKTEIITKFMDIDLIRAKLELASLNQDLRNIVDEIRDVIFNLRLMEFDDMGWNTCFKVLKEELSSNHNIQVNFNICENPECDELTLITIYRIVKECCYNTIKHAKASVLSVVIEEIDDHIRICVTDNGIGFEIAQSNKIKHYGFPILRERVFLLNGECNITSKKNEGTNIEILIPKEEY